MSENIEPMLSIGFGTLIALVSTLGFDLTGSPHYVIFAIIGGGMIYVPWRQRMEHDDREVKNAE